MSEYPIKVSVKTQYIDDQSRPKDEQFVYAYTISIENEGDRPAQLMSRHWHITDAKDNQQEVQGLGVVGEQPLIEPGESYSYTSGVVLKTTTGTMSGTYFMRFKDGEEFEAEIPTFALVKPSALH